MARDYLKVKEIKEILENHFDHGLVSTIMAEIEKELETCLCAATCYNECVCGAWEFGEGDLEEW